MVGRGGRLTFKWKGVISHDGSRLLSGWFQNWPHNNPPLSLPVHTLGLSKPFPLSPPWVPQQFWHRWAQRVFQPLSVNQPRAWAWLLSNRICVTQEDTYHVSCCPSTLWAQREPQELKRSCPDMQERIIKSVCRYLLKCARWSSHSFHEHSYRLLLEGADWWGWEGKFGTRA